MQGRVFKPMAFLFVKLRHRLNCTIRGVGQHAMVNVEGMFNFMCGNEVSLQSRLPFNFLALISPFGKGSLLGSEWEFEQVCTKLQKKYDSFWPYSLNNISQYL